MIEDTYMEEVRLSRELACVLEKHRWALQGDQYRDLIEAFNQLKRHYQSQIEEGVQ